MARATFLGGTLTKSGNLSSNPRPGVMFKTEIIMERLVRFDLAKLSGRSVMTDEDISKVINRSASYIRVMRTKDIYVRKRMELTTGISSDITMDTETSVRRHKQMLQLLIPDAMRVLVDSIQFQPVTLQEKKFRADIAKEILDREGTFPKISRTDIHSKIEHDFTATDGVSRALLDALDGEVQYKEQNHAIVQALEVNTAFSNSETLTAAEQEQALKALEQMPQTLPN